MKITGVGAEVRMIRYISFKAIGTTVGKPEVVSEHRRGSRTRKIGMMMNSGLVGEKKLPKIPVLHIFG